VDVADTDAGQSLLAPRAPSPGNYSTGQMAIIFFQTEFLVNDRDGLGCNTGRGLNEG
jgi:hypothetical protein